MRCGRRVSAATSVAAAFLVCCVGVSAGPVWAGEDGPRFLLFSGADLWRDGRFVHGGLLWSPGGLDHDGFTLRAVLSGGTYRYRSGALNDVSVTATEKQVQLLQGCRIQRDTPEIKVVGGPDMTPECSVPTSAST